MLNIVSFSGGKDSTAMLLRMLELGLKVDKVLFADTTLEFPEMYGWIDKIESIIPLQIERTRPKHSWDDWFYGKFIRGQFKDRIRGFPYVTQPCWWQRDGKVKPLKQAQGKGNKIFIGIAKDEEERSKKKVYQKGIYKFPLIDWGWTEDDCIRYLQSKGLNHPLLTKFKRTGCWLCPQQSRKSLESLYLYYPDLWKRLKKYERDSPQGFKPNFSLDVFEKKMRG